MDYGYQDKDYRERIKELQEYNSLLRQRINALTEKVNKIRYNKEKSFTFFH